MGRVSTSKKNSGYDMGRIDQALVDLRKDTQQILDEMKEIRTTTTESKTDRVAIRAEVSTVKEDLKNHKDAGTRQVGYVLTAAIIVVAIMELIIHAVEARFFR